MTDGTCNERACLVCRTTRPVTELLALVQLQLDGSQGKAVVCLGRDGALGGRSLDTAVRRGRGAWVCVARACLSNIGTKALGRAFRGPVEIPPAWRVSGGACLLQPAHELAQQRILEQLGLARRQGQVTLGSDQLSQAAPRGAVRVCAADLAPRTLNQAREAGAEILLSAETLGRAIGTGRAGVLTVAPGRLAQRLSYWLRVYRACAPSAPSGANIGAGAGGERGGAQTAGSDSRPGSGVSPNERVVSIERSSRASRGGESCAGLGV